MPIITDITKLSQVAANNGPDGAVDPPSALDDQDRYHGAFIAMLRDGVNFTPGAVVAGLGFTPVQQGGGTLQGPNKLKIGWGSDGSQLRFMVDATDFGNTWPIGADSAQFVRNAANGAGTKMIFSWSGQAGTPTYVWGGNDGTNMFVYQPAQMTVALAANANNAYACSGTAGYANNSGAVNGISGWSYSNQNYNPPYLWATAGSGSSQFLVQPANLTVNRANSAANADYCTGNCAGTAGTAGYCSGTAENANKLGGQAPGWYIHNDNSGAVNLHYVNPAVLSVGVNGVGDMAWNASASDQRLKKDIAWTREDSLTKIERVEFRQFRWRNDVLKVDVDPALQKLGVIAQQIEGIDSQWVLPGGTWKAPNINTMLFEAMHAIQQLSAKVRELEARV